MGVPAINLPLLKGKDGLPIGVQVITSWHKEAELLDISNMILKQA
jgi:Asp-tRNA(Asn)/Glu-tRNA(Gln) amidotransferase A subunit family amidase